MSDSPVIIIKARCSSPSTLASRPIYGSGEFHVWPFGLFVLVSAEHRGLEQGPHRSRRQGRGRWFLRWMWVHKIAALTPRLHFCPRCNGLIQGPCLTSPLFSPHNRVRAMQGGFWLVWCSILTAMSATLPPQSPPFGPLRWSPPSSSTSPPPTRARLCSSRSTWMIVRWGGGDSSIRLNNTLSLSHTHTHTHTHTHSLQSINQSNTHTYIHTQAHMHTYMNMHTHIHTHAHTHTHTCTRTHNTCTRTCTHTQTHTNTHTRMRAHAHEYTHTTHTYALSYIYIHVRTCAHMRTCQHMTLKQAHNAHKQDIQGRMYMCAQHIYTDANRVALRGRGLNSSSFSFAQSQECLFQFGASQ